MKVCNTIFVFIHMFTAVVFAADVSPQQNPKNNNYFWDQDGNLHKPPCSRFFEGIGEQKEEICEVQDWFLALKMFRSGETKFCSHNAFLFYGKSDEDKEEIARQFAVRDDAIIQVYDLDAIMSKGSGAGREAIRIYESAIELAKKEKKLAILYFNSAHTDRGRGVWLIKSCIDDYKENPYIVTIIAAKRTHDIDEATFSRLFSFEIKTPYWRDREKNIQNCANKCGVQLSPWYVKALAFGSYGASGYDIRKSFDQFCIQKDSDGEQSLIDKKKLFYELTKRNYLSVGVSCLAALGIVCGLQYAHIMKWFKEFSKSSESGK